MSDIFLHSRGRVQAFDEPDCIPMSLFLEGWGGFFGFKSIITQLKVDQTCGVQFLHTLRDFIYVYVFGDRIGEMNVSGLSFWDHCDAPSFHGIEYVNAYYLNNRVSGRATPVVVVLGLGTPFIAFLTNFSFDYNDPEQQIAQFRLGLHVIPEESAI
jgi:hypothetical protein